MDNSQSDYTYEINCAPDFSYINVRIPTDQTIKVEASAMATMDVNVKMKTRVRGGLGRFLTGENIFINEFSAQDRDGEINISPGPAGDIKHLYLDGDTVFLQNSAFVASGVNVEAATKWQGLVKGFFSGEGLFLIKCSGSGDLWFNSYGAIIEIDVDGAYIVDTSYIVAFTDGLNYSIKSVGGYKSLFLSGEGLVCRFEGSGKIWIQTRQVPAFSSWIYPFRPAPKKKD